MQPLGRKPVQIPNCKIHLKHNGKNIAAWWEEENGSKRGERMQSKRDIKLLIKNNNPP